MGGGQRKESAAAGHSIIEGERMASTPLNSGRATEATEEENQLECPHCRRLGDGELRWGVARCTTCGYRLIASTGQSETDAWNHLYGRPPARLR